MVHVKKFKKKKKTERTGQRVSKWNTLKIVRPAIVAYFTSRYECEICLMQVNKSEIWS